MLNSPTVRALALVPPHNRVALTFGCGHRPCYENNTVFRELPEQRNTDAVCEDDTVPPNCSSLMEKSGPRTNTCPAQGST